MMGRAFQDQEDFFYAKKRMVTEQLVSRGISDQNVLNAFLKVDRHHYVLPQYQSGAYEDNPLPIEAEQTISQPYVVALMMELLKLKKTDKVLEIGTGSGYLTALLAEIVETVVSIECVDLLYKKSQKKLLSQYSNVLCVHGDGSKGYSEQASYDKIVVSAATLDIPTPWIDQLQIGGLMVVPIGMTVQNLLRLKKVVDSSSTFRLQKEVICGVRFVPLVKKNR